MALKKGYSKSTIAANIDARQKAGESRPGAIRAAMDAARLEFFAKYPNGALPLYLAWPAAHRTRDHYSSTGAPQTAIHINPVRKLALTASEARAVATEAQRATSTRSAAVKRAAALYARFTGHDGISIAKARIPDMPPAVTLIGKIDSIRYTTKREGKTEHYQHDFKQHARPLFAVSPDGRQLYMLGGAFTFGDRGIVDHK